MLNKTCVACTPFFQSLEDKVELQLKGCISTDMELSYVLYSYDNQGLETEIHSSGVSISENGLFEICYTFDPISLAVYKNAVKFCAKLYAETEESEIELKEFTFMEVCEETSSAEGVKTSISNLTVNEQGEKCVLVQQSNGQKITVPLVPKKVLFLGNSLLLGMFHTYGMCASSPKKDYAYLVQKRILKYNKDCIFYKLHGGNFEHAEDREAFEAWFSKDENVYTKMPAENSFREDLDLIFIQLTDNVNTEEKTNAFKENVDLFMERIKKKCPKARIIWIYGWYNKQNTEDKLVELCDRWSLERIDISSLRGKENQSYSGQISWHPEMGEMIVKDTWITHPGDEGMAKIAERIIELLGIEE